jgi:transcriptional regulator with XRE-family HTH domain
MKMIKNNYLKLGKIIKFERGRKGFSRRKCAALVDISDTELKRIEDGERQVPNLITLINICKLLELDLLNLLDDTGFYEMPEEELFYVVIKNKEPKVFKIHAQNEYQAIRTIIDFISGNDIFELDKSLNNFTMCATKNEEELKEILKNFNEKSEDELAIIIADHLQKDMEQFEKEHKGYDEIFDDEDEDYDETEDDISECFSCEHYCPICGECTLGE